MMLLFLISSTLAWNPMDCLKKQESLPKSSPIPDTHICSHSLTNTYNIRGKYYEDRTSSLVFTHDDEIFKMNALFDGHGGSLVANRLSKEFLTDLERKIKTKTFGSDMTKVKKSLEKLIRKVVFNRDKSFCATGRFYDHVGSTAVFTIEFRNFIVVANIGDSRAIIYSTSTTSPSILFETTDHSSSSESEQTRAKNAGGRVTIKNHIYSNGDTYLEARINGLAVSRAFADCVAKYSGAPTFRHNLKYEPDGVISVVPDISFINLDGKKDLRLLLVSDGLVEQMSSQEVVNYLVNAEEDCVELVAKARDYSKDDLTVVLKSLNKE